MPKVLWFTSHFPLSASHPFRSPLPGIISTLDAYIKQVVNSTFFQKGQLPDWLTQALGEIEVIETLQPQRWQAEVKGFVLIGEPDAVWKLGDGSVFITDYKVAQLTQAQDALFPLYEAQLKAYAYLAEKNGRRVSGLALVYLQPQRYRDEPQRLVEITADQFTLHFTCAVKPIESWKPEEVEGMVCEVGNILVRSSPPDSKGNCKGCLTVSPISTSVRGCPNGIFCS